MTVMEVVPNQIFSLVLAHAFSKAFQAQALAYIKDNQERKEDDTSTDMDNDLYKQFQENESNQFSSSFIDSSESTIFGSLLGDSYTQEDDTTTSAEKKIYQAQSDDLENKESSSNASTHKNLSSKGSRIIRNDSQKSNRSSRSIRKNLSSKILDKLHFDKLQAKVNIL